MYNGDLYHVISDWDTEKVFCYKWGGKTSRHIEVRTKDIDFGQPGVKKKVYKIYLTYKGDGTNVTVQAFVNGLEAGELNHVKAIAGFQEGADADTVIVTADNALVVNSVKPLTVEISGTTNHNGVYDNITAQDGTTGAWFKMAKVDPHVSSEAVADNANMKWQLINDIKFLPTKNGFDGSSAGGSVTLKPLKNTNIGFGAFDPDPNEYAGGDYGWVTAELKPDSAGASALSNIYSISLRIATDGTTAVPSDFEIGSINIVYRMKSVK